MTMDATAADSSHQGIRDSLETDPSKILYWEDVKSKEAMLTYYRQRLGAGFYLRKGMGLLIRPEVYREFVLGPEAILIRASAAASEAMRDIQIFFEHVKPAQPGIYMSMDSAEAGRDFIDTINRLASTELERNFGAALIELSRVYASLYSEWVSKGRPYYSILRANRPTHQIERSSISGYSPT